MDFALDLKHGVDHIHGNKRDIVECDDIICDCRRLFYSHFENFCVGFTMRQANEAIHIYFNKDNCIFS
jgi:hypothetical protein